MRGEAVRLKEEQFPLRDDMSTLDVVLWMHDMMEKRGI